eukprot:m.31645 g.31645  ORF g.31645 m.31645 type:complete len:95 (+) comp10763_c0_seq1:453-737(+)
MSPSPPPPPPAKSEAAAAEPQDCFTCKATGSAIFAGLGAYMFYERAKMPVEAKSRRMYVAVVGSALLVMAAGRWFVGMPSSQQPAAAPSSTKSS